MTVSVILLTLSWMSIMSFWRTWQKWRLKRKAIDAVTNVISLFASVRKEREIDLMIDLDIDTEAVRSALDTLKRQLDADQRPISPEDARVSIETLLKCLYEMLAAIDYLQKQNKKSRPPASGRGSNALN
jgi:hypothetical protein